MIDRFPRYTPTGEVEGRAFGLAVIRDVLHHGDEHGWWPWNPVNETLDWVGFEESCIYNLLGDLMNPEAVQEKDDYNDSQWWSEFRKALYCDWEEMLAEYRRRLPQQDWAGWDKWIPGRLPTITPVSGEITATMEPIPESNPLSEWNKGNACTECHDPQVPKNLVCRKCGNTVGASLPVTVDPKPIGHVTQASIDAHRREAAVRNQQDFGTDPSWYGGIP